MIFYDKFYFLYIVKKKIKKKVFEEKFGTLGKNDVIEKMLMSSYFFCYTNVFIKRWCTPVTSFKAKA